ncbi:DNA polymerase domain-containing protein [Synoicihabitans lomoniglobus]|uniref:DNA-directed DNA polymerase n=1 Tax=Synoicihabitans lomoniglobus TaxID=2909285 RepID=A0AAF0CSN6_9BACT|nr:DNA polymerase [Opitutaceae bacterium LMO-M01]WED67309.1 DNA polymerase domain-containing protein [Opitutaceae bacterium LMO-M01]
MADALCGIWVDRAGQVHLAHRATADGVCVESEVALQPFAWLDAEPAAELLDGVPLQKLTGDGAFMWLARPPSLDAYDALIKRLRGAVAVDGVRPLESQHLLETRQRLFADVSFAELRRCQLDIETASSGNGFSDATLPDDRVLAIGLRFGDRDRTLVLAEPTDAAEKAMLAELNAVLAEEDPDTIEGHNIFKFDFDFLRLRAKRLKVPCAWGRFGQRANFRRSRLKVAERWIDFPRCDLPGRTVVDTFLLVQLYDITTRELTAFGLKDVAVHFGITSVDGSDRTYIAGNKIQDAYASDRATFLAYLADDLRETKGIADRLLPTYFEQVRTFPITLQEATLRGTTGKIDLLFQEHYYHAGRSTPAPPEVKPFEGGYTRSFQEGVFKHVLHFDVASLYPSLLLHIGRNPKNDALGVFIPLLKQLREYRLRYKQLARSAESAEERAEADARQASFKILINSFYGYLGFSGARFGDGELAAEVTQRGRDLLQALIEELSRQGATILEADTDGIYLSTPEYFDRPEELLAKAAAILPAGIELEYDGRYESMFCYKAKNYALYDGERITLKGSALRSRGIEPYLKRLSDSLISHLLGVGGESPSDLVVRFRDEIPALKTPVQELAKTEILSQNPDTYEKFIATGGKPRRASAEVALQMTPRPSMGDRISYYILPRQKGQTSDWQRARALDAYDPMMAAYDPKYYLKKLDDWVKRYEPFLDATKLTGPEEQGSLF